MQIGTQDNFEPASKQVSFALGDFEILIIRLCLSIQRAKCCRRNSGRGLCLGCGSVLWFCWLRRRIDESGPGTRSKGKVLWNNRTSRQCSRKRIFYS